MSSLLLTVTGTQAVALVKSTTDTETQLVSWTLTEHAFSLELIQRLPDQTRAFFQGRGFSNIVANDIATQCVLQSIGKNTSSNMDTGSISYNLEDWEIRNKSKTQGIKLKEQWDKEWSKNQVTPASRIAFRWATFPTQQSFNPGGDFNWGMISFGLSPGATFDLKVVWKQNNTTHSQWIRKIQCPTDR